MRQETIEKCMNVTRFIAQGFTQEQACRKAKVSPSMFWRFNKLGNSRSVATQNKFEKVEALATTSLHKPELRTLMVQAAQLTDKDLSTLGRYCNILSGAE